MCKGLTFLIKGFICRIIGVDYLWIWSQFAWRLFTLSYSVSNQKLPAQWNQIKARPTSWQTAPVCVCVFVCVWLSLVCTIDCWPHERHTQLLPLLVLLCYPAANYYWHSAENCNNGGQHGVCWTCQLLPGQLLLTHWLDTCTTRRRRPNGI